MSRLTKAEREQVRQKYGGRCAYCGEPLQARWHADHFEPVLRRTEIARKDGRAYWKSGPPTRPERDVAANHMPSCPPCNIDKHAMSLQSWREKLARTLEVLNRNYPTFRHAVRFGLVQETNHPITFYFERVEKELTNEHSTEQCRSA